MKDMKINGKILIDELHIKQGIEVGCILRLLFEEVLDGVLENESHALLARAIELKNTEIDKLPELNMAEI